MAKWKIKDQTLLGYSVPIILFILFAGLVYLNGAQTKSILDQLVESQGSVLSTNKMSLKISLMARQVRGYMLVKNVEGAAETYAKERDNFKEAAKQAESTIKIIGTSKEQENLDKVMSLFNEFTDLAAKTFQLIDQDKQPEAIALYLPNSKRILGNLNQLVDQINEIELAKVKGNLDNTRGSINFIQLMSIVMVAICIIAAYFVASITQKSLDSMINEIKQTEIQTQNSFGILINQMQESGISVITSATELAASGKQLEATITQQAASITEVAATAKEISATSGQLTRTMEGVGHTAKNTAHAASDSQKNLIDMEKTMLQLAEATHSVAAKLGTMSSKANNINSVVSTITKVAVQTNLLSLNAAIEAEKAGEYGAGFSVVAREIRRLADQTAVATLEIEQMVKEMQGAVSTGVMEMDKFTKEVEQGVDNVHSISVKLESIIEQVQDLTPQFQDVSDSMEGQFEGAQQISGAMEQLNEVSSHTTDSLRRINEAIGRLNQVSQNLHQEIANFQGGRV